MFCGCENSKVIDSRGAEGSNSIRRRRECLGCGKRFTTYETVETTPVTVVKADGTRQPFDAEKIKQSVLFVCDKNSVTPESVDAVVSASEKEIFNSENQEITTAEIAEIVLKNLKDTDKMAYVRFAALYKHFDSVPDFADFIKTV